MGVAVGTETDFTIPKLLLENQQKWADKVWMRKKELGFWREYTWKEACGNIKNFSLGLTSLGFQRGDVMAILGDNDPHWFWAQLAAQAAGGVVTGVFSSSGAKEVKYFLEHSDAKIVVAQDQEQVDKILEIKNELPLVKKVIYWDPKGLRGYDDPILASFDSVAEIGVEYGKAHPGVFEESIAKGRISDLALLMYTSGTTGLPKAAMVSYASLVSSNTAFYTMNPITEKDEWVSFILPGWSAEQGLGLLGSLNRGVKMSFPESQATVQENIREIGATVLMYPSRLWEMTAATIQNKISETTFLKRQAFRALPSHSLQGCRCQVQGGEAGLDVVDTTLDRQAPGIRSVKGQTRPAQDTRCVHGRIGTGAGRLQIDHSHRGGLASALWDDRDRGFAAYRHGHKGGLCGSDIPRHHGEDQR